jgi:hypothetical protein
MNGTKFMGMVLGVIGVVLLGGGIYFAITYVGGILNAMVEFVTSNSGAISNCGITVPEEIVGMKDQIATAILPGIYLGVPLAVIIISAIMFAGGYFYGRGSYQDQLNSEKKHEKEVEEEVERRVFKKKQRAKKTAKEEEPEEDEEE